MLIHVVLFASEMGDYLRSDLLYFIHVPHHSFNYLLVYGTIYKFMIRP